MGIAFDLNLVRLRRMFVLGVVSVLLVGLGCERRPASGEAPTPATTGRVDPNLMDAVARLEAQEQQFNQTLWAKEILAQDCGRVFEDLWDQIQSATNKLATAARFPVNELVLGTWSLPEQRPHGITQGRFTAPSITWSPVEWSGRLTKFAQDGWVLNQTEFRHVHFETTREGKPKESRFYFSAHLSNLLNSNRAILEGNLVVQWAAPDNTNNDSISIQRIDARGLALKTRSGEAPFQLVLQEAIAMGSQPFSNEPLLVYDLDRDGISELILPIRNRAYRRQEDGSYLASKLCQQAPGIVGAALLADFDADGHADLVCATPEGLMIYPGDGTLYFGEPAQLAWKPELRLPSAMVLTCGDMDHDGDLDVFLGQYKMPYQGGQMPTPYFDANDGDPAYLLRNEGLRRFTDTTPGSGLAPKRFRRSLSGSFAHLDGDRHLDLVVVSDFAGVDVYQGDGTGRFVEITPSWILEPHAFGMGHALADMNADGLIDLLVTGMPSPTADRLDSLGLWRENSESERSVRSKMTFGSRLFRGLAAGGFEQFPIHDTVARSGWSWGCSALDFDNDGFPDLYIANGMESRESVRDYEAEFWLHDLHVANSQENPVVDLYLRSKATRLRGRGTSYGGYEKNRFYINLQGTSFIEVAHLMGVALELDSRSVVADDIDGDGRMDLVVNHFELWPQSRRAVRIYRNTLENTGHWIGFRFPESLSHSSPVCATATVHAGGRVQVRQLITGDSHHAQSANTLHFGLGSATQVDRVEIRWPSGMSMTLTNPAIDRYHTLRLETATQRP